MPFETSPMDSKRPKTPSWAFTAPHLVKNSKSYACCHFSFFQALLQARHIAPVKDPTWLLSVFSHKTQHQRMSRKMRQFFEQLPGIKPPRAEELGAWGHVAMSRAHKGLTVLDTPEIDMCLDAWAYPCVPN
jgi:hypothetical protein